MQTTLELEGIDLPANSMARVKELCQKRDEMRLAPRAPNRSQYDTLI